MGDRYLIIIIIIFVVIEAIFIVKVLKPQPNFKIGVITGKYKINNQFYFVVSSKTINVSAHDYIKYDIYDLYYIKEE